MTTKHLDKYAKAIRKIKENGLAIEFEPIGMTGYAVEIPGDPIEYANLQLVEREPVTIWFVADMLGDEPPLNSTFDWNGRQKTVYSRMPIRPDGVALVIKVIAV